jgi:HD-GYP domain-containing protein (c-di-GMP phosphodiesterase class II)
MSIPRISIPLANVISSLQQAVKAKDAYTAGHNRRVARYAVNLATAVGLGAESIRAVDVGGQLHDVGKIGVADRVLMKPARLTADEFKEVSRHSTIGGEICRRLELDPLVLDIVRLHHERLDGSGYPNGLGGSQIPLEVQIVGVVDVVDALLTHRLYRSAYSMEDTWNILDDEASRGLHDADLINACIRAMASGELFESSGGVPDPFDWVEQEHSIRSGITECSTTGIEAGQPVVS